MSDLDKCCDDGDRGGPTSHRYLYDMPRDELFTMFAGVVQTIHVDGGQLCGDYEAPAFVRMARAVEARVNPDDPDEAKLSGVATVLRVLLSRADGLDNGEDQTHLMPIHDLVGYFVELRTELPDRLPPGGPVSTSTFSDEREWSDELIAELPVCPGCRTPMIPAYGGLPAVDHSGCRPPEPLQD